MALLLQLPEDVDTENITARVSNGELTVIVPRNETRVKQKTVTVD